MKTTKDGKNYASIAVGGEVTESWISWVGDTNYNIDAGDAAHDFSFLGPDPHNKLVRWLNVASSIDYETLTTLHANDYADTVTSRFSLDLGQTPDFLRSTKEQVKAYEMGVNGGNPHLEWVLFNYGRYMLATSAKGVLPSNLQGVWAKGRNPPWSAGEYLILNGLGCTEGNALDYHANINTQMNYWGAEVSRLFAYRRTKLDNVPSLDHQHGRHGLSLGLHGCK